jgi:hypothetical protein
MGRRLGLALVAAAFVGLLLLRPLAHAQGSRYDGPLVDTHGHLDVDGNTNPDTLIALYDRGGVRGGWVFGWPWTLATGAWERYPQRVVPFLAEGYTATIHPDSSYLNAAGLEELLAGGYVRGLGEVILRHSAFRLGASGGGFAAPATNVAADHPGLVRAYEIAGRFGAPVVVHQEMAFAAELERAVRAAPATQFVWAHAGHGSAQAVREVLARNPNLHADLSARTPWLGPGTVLTDSFGRIQPAWSALLAEYPDRFVIGLDLFVPQHFRAEYVQDTVGYYRGLLGQLDPTTAEQIGFRNAERLAPFRVPPSGMSVAPDLVGYWRR